MFKKFLTVIILLIICSPLFGAVLMGYPVRNTAHPDGSVRCFKVGELGEYFSCAKAGRFLKEGRLLGRIADDAGSFSAYFPVVLTLTLFTSMAATVLIAFEGKPVEKKKLQHPVDKKKRESLRKR